LSIFNYIFFLKNVGISKSSCEEVLFLVLGVFEGVEILESLTCFLPNGFGLDIGLASQEKFLFESSSKPAATTVIFNSHS